MAPETAGAAARAAQGRCARDGADRGDHGGQANRGSDPALPSAAADARSRSSSSSRTTGVAIAATAETTAQTGVEMEALTAASVAALTVYDMAKAIDKAMVIGEVRLAREDEGARVKAAVLTVSDGVAAGRARGRERRPPRGAARRARATRSSGAIVPDERAEIAAAIRELAGGARVVLTTGRNRPRAARRDARGDRGGARPPGAGDRRGAAGRLDREDAARAARPRRRRDASARRSS